MELSELRKMFQQRYAIAPRLFRAPGRVNLIGEHTDYNDGFVMPLALDRETIAAVAAVPGRRVKVYSRTYDESAEFDLDSAPHPQTWVRYVEGVARVLEAHGVRLCGAHMVIDSDVPVGAGLSSSSALEISVGLAFLALCGAKLDAKQLALRAQEAEQTYGGVQCGIMDQLTAVMAQRDTALLIDCRSLETTYIPLDAARATIAICDSRVKHDLAASEYNRRRAECERGVELLSQVLPGIRALRDVSLDDFRRFEHVLPEPIRSRCRHVVTENPRTLAAAAALRAGHLEEAGRLMTLSHASLRDDYQVSSPEQNLLVRVAGHVEGVFGARMTGAGFGGCTVNLLRPEVLERFREAILDEFESEFAREPGFYAAVASDGASEIV
jgi:galactokinase